MEGGDHSVGNGGSRWNPTKEQINMLESLYKQGLRTPSADQIQHITARLRDFGHIEGKNVFYWFQNHKARQRQKQKQETFAFYNRFLHPTPVFPPYHNVVRSQCYIPPQKNDEMVCHHHSKVPLPIASGSSLKRSRITPESIDTSPTRYNTNMHCYSNPRNSSVHHQETLDLFPIHPTGVLHSTNQNEIKNHSFGANNSSTDRDVSSDDHPFFDFFCGN